MNKFVKKGGVSHLFENMSRVLTWSSVNHSVSGLTFYTCHPGSSQGDGLMCRPEVVVPGGDSSQDVQVPNP